MMFFLVAVSFLCILLRMPTSAMECGFHTTGLQGTISSPFQDPTFHTSSFECIWNIEVPSGYTIQLEATSFALPGIMGNCKEGYVYIESLTTSNNTKSHGIYCGSDIGMVRNVHSLENRLRIRYWYNGYNKRLHWSKTSYFVFSYKSVAPPSSYKLTEKWIKQNNQTFLDAKDILPRTISALFLFNETYFLQGNSTTSDLITQFQLKLAADLIRNTTHPVSAAELSHHVTALLAICSNPRSVYGVDLVHHLRNLVNKEKGLVNPYYLLTLCNAGERMTSTDLRKLKSVIESHKKDVFLLDFQAMALMTLICMKEQDNKQNVEQEILKAVSVLKKHQLKDESFGSLQTTSLVVQALTAADAIQHGWDRASAVKYIDRANNSDGSFGNLYNLYSAIPVISGKTLLYINSSKCDFTSDGLTPLEEIKNKLAEPIHVLYSLWIGDTVDYAYAVAIKVPLGTKFLDFIRLASEIDEKFQFRWKYVKSVPYIYEINGLINDPSSGKYWTFYSGTDFFNLKPHTKSLDDYTPDDGDVAVMWYKTVVTEDHLQEIEESA